MNIEPRENWRVYLLLVLLLVSTVAVFVPLGGADTDGPTNLQYGLELSGGTRVRAPLVGMTAEVDTGGTDTRELAATLSNRLNVSRTDVNVRQARAGQGQQARNGQDTVEVFANEDNGNVTQQEFAAALNAAGVDASTNDIRAGVTQETRQTAVSVLSNKINSVGLSGGTVSTTTTPTGETFVLVEVPNANRSEVLELITSRGRVELVAHFPQQRENRSGNGTRTVYRDVSLLTQADFSNRNFQARQAEGGRPPRVPVSLEQGPARNFSNAMQRFGFTRPAGIDNCGYRPDSGSDPDTFPGYCLYTVRDGEVVYGASMSGGPDGLAPTIRRGDHLLPGAVAGRGVQTVLARDGARRDGRRRRRRLPAVPRARRGGADDPDGRRGGVPADGLCLGGRARPRPVPHRRVHRRHRHGGGRPDHHRRRDPPER
jgi:preprotein translocase subunit SecD